MSPTTTTGADACAVCTEGPQEMNLSFQPPEEDDPHDDDQRYHEDLLCLPCPFCGNDKNISVANEKHDHSGGYFIACPMCEASTGLRYACGEDPRPFLVAQWNQRASYAPRTRGYMGSTPDGGIDDHDAPRNWIPPSDVQVAMARWPEHLTRAVDQWFAQNTGLGGCSDSDVSQLAAIFYSLAYKGGRESVDDALAVIDSFGPGIEGLNDTYARQVILAAEVKRVRDLYAMAVIGRHQMRQALMTARDHIPMNELWVSHCRDAEAITKALSE